ncbi:MUS81, partial [Branchiostoma lanceolatum]
MVRIYVRNKGRYDPKTSENPLPFLDVDNPGDVLIKHVRETVKRRINCKLDELYYNNQLLDEDRSVAYSNLQDGTILESCSNPFWAACMYIRLRAVEQEAANNPTDQKKQRWTHQSILNRAAALGVLFNSNSFERHQPPHLPTLQDLWTCLQTNGRKPVHMSEFTRTALQELQEEFQNIDVHRRDPLASFVHRHAVKLGFRDPNAPGPGDGPVYDGPAGQGAVGNALGARGNNNNNRNGGRRRQNRPRPCDDCEAENATKYCAQCEGGLVLCKPCCDRLHQGRARRHHNIQGVEEAPKAAKSYTPKAYKAPFAMLVALFKGLSQVPQIMSMTADDIKSRAQVFTDTDLSDRAAGKFFGGFDNMQNTLQINGFVQREAGENARFSLLQPGRTLAQKCTEFHQAVEDLLNVNRVPKVPQLGGTQFGPRRVCLLVDSKEPLCERMMALAHRQGVAAQIRDLPVGDFLWILLPPAAGVDYAEVLPNDEQVLPHIVERKTWDDLQNSLSTRRFRNQVEAMKRCGLRDLFYLVEGHPS